MNIVYIVIITDQYANASGIRFMDSQIPNGCKLRSGDLIRSYQGHECCNSRLSKFLRSDVCHYFTATVY